MADDEPEKGSTTEESNEAEKGSTTEESSEAEKGNTIEESSEPEKAVEENTANLLERYSEQTVLQLLQEVDKSASPTIDWHEMVKNTRTGISNAREYQMLWRHLAYGHDLIDQLDDSNPLDDDSDLEHEIESDPEASPKSKAEAAACVNVLATSEHPIIHEPNSSTVEAPLTMKVAKWKRHSDSSLPDTIEEKLVTITVPLPNDELSASETSSADAPSPRKTRVVWTAVDDLRLTNSVRKYGENWDLISGVNFKHERTAHELSRKWAAIKRRRASARLSPGRRASTRTINLVLARRRQMSTTASNPTSTINVDADVGGSGSISNPSCSQDAVVPVQMTTGPSSLTLAPVANQPSSSQAQGESFTVPITTEESPDGDQASSSLDQTLDLNQALRNLATEDTGDQASMSSSHHRQTMDLDAALTSPGAEDTGKKHGDTSNSSTDKPDA
ncbi:flocculation protein FLO11-like isoform X2 [Salvia hispanica]|uniref:flocculation protein FLO11-like isoform X2 n=1 Tax=Salvia hispanica TaxID=49212 RepID=UPI0020091E10|nr:flocculation protein FLO11-like isoform X2 [Salvia hispanica]